MGCQLEREGKTDVKMPVPQYVPELAGSAWDTVTVAHAGGRVLPPEVIREFRTALTPAMYSKGAFGRPVERRRDRVVRSSERPLLLVVSLLLRELDISPWVVFWTLDARVLQEEAGSP